jgi:hypothetical protein
MKLFGRTEKQEAPEVTTVDGGKGRPTPSRKDAQAAAKERARAGMDKKSAQKVLKDSRGVSNKRMREGMRAGEEKYLPARDQGPVKRFVRNWVDARLTFTEFLFPVLIAVMVLSAVGGNGDSKHPSLTSRIGNYLWTASILLLIVDVMFTRFRLRQALNAKFPDEDTKGTALYAFTRTMSPRFLRLPKPMVKIGGKPK